MPGNTEPSTIFDTASVPGRPGVRDIQVAPDKILQAAAVIEEQASALQRSLAGHLAALRIPVPSEDIVSAHTVHAWNEVIAGGEESYEGRVRSYVQRLRDLAEQLRTAAEDYGLNEDEQAATLGDLRGHGAG